MTIKVIRKAQGGGTYRGVNFVLNYPIPADWNLLGKLEEEMTKEAEIEKENIT